MRKKISRKDCSYPALLREIPDPPEVLRVAGNPIEPAPAVAVVGSRRVSTYGLEAAAWIAHGLATAGVTVVSGMASGIDAAAHKGALSAGGFTVGVLGCGVDICYPPSNKSLYRMILESGALVSEHEDGVQAIHYHFPIRNRIIAGMSLATVVIEGRAGGGAMITARLAMEFGREVFALPGPVHSPLSAGGHALIRDGATLATSAEEILEDLNLGFFKASAEERIQLDPDEHRVLAKIGAEPVLLDQLARRVRIPMSTMSAILGSARDEEPDLPLSGRPFRAVGAGGRLDGRLSRWTYTQIRSERPICPGHFEE